MQRAPLDRRSSPGAQGCEEPLSRVGSLLLGSRKFQGQPWSTDVLLPLWSLFPTVNERFEVVVADGILAGHTGDLPDGTDSQERWAGQIAQFWWLTPSRQLGHPVTSVLLGSPLHSLEVRLILPSLLGQWGNSGPWEGTVCL